MAKKRANGEGNIRKRADGRWEGRYTAGYAYVKLPVRIESAKYLPAQTAHCRASSASFLPAGAFDSPRLILFSCRFHCTIVCRSRPVLYLKNPEIMIISGFFSNIGQETGKANRSRASHYVRNPRGRKRFSSVRTMRQ